MSLAPEENGVPNAAVGGGPPGSALDVECPEPGLAPGVFRDVLAGMSEAAVLTDDQRIVQWRNRAAHDLLPELSLETALTAENWGAWAEPRESPREFDLGDRHVEVRTQELSDGWTCWYLNDVTVQRNRENALLAERARQVLLARAGRLFAATLSSERLLRSALNLLSDHGMRRCAVVLVDSEQDVMLGRWDEQRLSKWEPSPFRPLRGDHQVVRLEGDLQGPPEWLGAVSSFELRTYAAPFGMLLVPAGEHVDHELLATFAGQLAANLHAASLHQRRGNHAETLRNSLTQRELPRIEGAELAAAYRPSVERDRIGGDFYEVTPAEGGGWSFALGDVCGKGVEAAVLSGQTRHVLHAASFLDLGPAARLDLLNKVICSERTRRFVTLITGT